MPHLIGQLRWPNYLHNSNGGNIFRLIGTMCWNDQIKCTVFMNIFYLWTKLELLMERNKRIGKLSHIQFCWRTFTGPWALTTVTVAPLPPPIQQWGCQYIMSFINVIEQHSVYCLSFPSSSFVVFRAVNGFTLLSTLNAVTAPHQITRGRMMDHPFPVTPGFINYLDIGGGPRQISFNKHRVNTSAVLSLPDWSSFVHKAGMVTFKCNLLLPSPFHPIYNI